MDILAASPWKRGGRRHTCCLDARMLQSSYLLPRRRCEAAVALPATFKPGSRSRLTCCLAVDARRLSHFLRRSSPEAEVVLPAASPWMRDCCRTACDIEDRRPKSFYLPPRRGCEAALVLPAALKPKSSYLPPCRGCEEVSTYLPPGGRRLSCCLAVDARRRSHCLRPG